MGLFNSSNQILAEKALDAVWHKQRVISNNIANVETPDFKAGRVDFKLILNEKRNCRYSPVTRDKGGPAELKVITSHRADTNQILNGNNVDMEKEAIALADAQYQYAALIDRLNSEYRMIRSALSR